MATRVAGMESGRDASVRFDVGQLLAGRYEIIEAIGHGGMGAVYRAYDRNRHEEIAIKVLQPHLLSHPKATQWFLEEAKIASRLSHPHIVNVFDVQTDGHVRFLTMELLSGTNLREVLRKRRDAHQSFTADEIARLGREIGSALEYAHRSLLHRDVKPENIWVDLTDEHKLMDFGIARLLGGGELTQTSAGMGTAYYMSPEQLRGERELDGRTDQYALGVVLYEVATGGVPIGRFRPLAQARRDLPRAICRTIERALDPDPAKRFPSMTEFVRALGGKEARVSSELAGKLVIAACVFALIGVGWMMWPQIRSLMPDLEAVEDTRSQAIRSQGSLDSLLGRLESSQREVESRLREAKGSSDRIEGMLRMARSESERADLAIQLQAAQAERSIWQQVDQLSRQLVFESDLLIQIRGQIALGESALKDGRHDEAAQELGAAEASLRSMLSVPENAQFALKARQRLQAAEQRIIDLAKREAVDAEPFLQQVRFESDSAGWLLSAGELGLAGARYEVAETEARKAMTALLDKLIAGYSKFADRALEANQLREAEAALGKAKALERLKPAGP